MSMSITVYKHFSSQISAFTAEAPRVENNPMLMLINTVSTFNMIYVSRDITIILTCNAKRTDHVIFS